MLLKLGEFVINTDHVISAQLKDAGTERPILSLRFVYWGGNNASDMHFDGKAAEDGWAELSRLCHGQTADFIQGKLQH